MHTTLDLDIVLDLSPRILYGYPCDLCRVQLVHILCNQLIILELFNESNGTDELETAVCLCRVRFVAPEPTLYAS
jgi:hypothetical protein